MKIKFHIECMNNDLKIGEMISILLKKRGKSLRELAEITQIPYSTLYAWRENRQPKDVKKLKSLADVLEVSVDELLFGENFETEGEKFIFSSRDGNFEIKIKKVDARF